MSAYDADTIIIGAGLAGLQCARTLRAAGQSFLLLEAGDAVGGRVRTDIHEGFRLDRGFQIYLDAYPAGKANLDYDALDLKPFVPGTLVWDKGTFHRLGDPWKRPDQLFATLRASVGSLDDKIKIASLRAATKHLSLDEIFAKPETTTRTALKRKGFSAHFIDSFFRPFLGGIFLENKLETSSRFFEFVFKMFSEGHAVVPAKGMQEIPNQLARTLPSESIRLNAWVASLQEGVVKLGSGESFSGRNIVLAVDADAAKHLRGQKADLAVKAWNGTTSLYFAADVSPVDEPILVLNGSNEGPINSLVVMTDVSPQYSASGEALVSISILGDPPESDDQLAARVKTQLLQWYGSATSKWRLLRVVRVPRALPVLTSVPACAERFSQRENEWVCGDFQATPSIQGALESGARVGEAILKSRV